MKTVTDLTNKTIGKLTVISRAPNSGRRVRWNCKCECGNVKIIDANNLRTGASKSCGCTRSKYGAKSPNFTGCGEIGGKYFWELKHGAIRRGYSFELTIEHLWDLAQRQGKLCALSGIPLLFEGPECNASVDRIDSNKGYAINNIQWVHKDINWMKVS